MRACTERTSCRPRRCRSFLCHLLSTQKRLSSGHLPRCGYVPRRTISICSHRGGFAGRAGSLICPLASEQNFGIESHVRRDPRATVRYEKYDKTNLWPFREKIGGGRLVSKLIVPPSCVETEHNSIESIRFETGWKKKRKSGKNK